jgi:phosphoglycerate kinase
MQSIECVSVESKRVLVRSDLDVPLTTSGEVAENFRLQKTIPTVNYLLKSKAKIILIAHLGRPEGEVKEEFSLRPVAEKLTSLLGREVALVKNYLTDEGRKEVEAVLARDSLVLLENLRFYPGEEENQPGFARSLASLADIFVNDAFAVSHRAHASIVSLPKYLPSYAGITLENEVKVLSEALTKPKRPLLALIGGAKIETKLTVISHLSSLADQILVGGRLLMEKVPSLPKVVFPEEVVVAEKSEEDFKGIKVKAREKVLPGELILDLGPRSQQDYTELIARAKTVIWNGPMGLFEDERFAAGTKSVAEAIVRHCQESIVGGGETIEALNKFGLMEKISHVSTGGGAMLEFLAGKKLPGTEALRSSYETTDSR